MVKRPRQEAPNLHRRLGPHSCHVHIHIHCQESFPSKSLQHVAPGPTAGSSGELKILSSPLSAEQEVDSATPSNQQKTMLARCAWTILQVWGTGLGVGRFSQAGDPNVACTASYQSQATVGALHCLAVSMSSVASQRQQASQTWHTTLHMLPVFNVPSSWVITASRVANHSSGQPAGSPS